MLNPITRFSVALVFVVSLVDAGRALGQPQQGQGQMRDDGAVVIDTPPPVSPPEAPTPAPSEGAVVSDSVILQLPGRVLLSGKPVRLDFRSPTDGVAFQLLAGGAYSQVSGVSYGVGVGAGFGGWGYGGYGMGMSPYYGEVITRAYQPICEAPCQATLLSGTHRMALSLRGGAPVNASEPVVLTDNAIVEGRYVDKRRLRKAGWAVFISGAIAGMAMMFASVNYQYDPFVNTSQIRNPGVFYTGVGLFVSSIITGSVLASQSDQAHINVYPVE